MSEINSGHNENSPDSMGAFVRHCDDLRRATGAHVMVIHHSGKDETRGARGHSLLNGAVVTEIEISAKSDRTATATVTKQRDHDCGDTIAFHLEPVGDQQG